LQRNYHGGYDERYTGRATEMNEITIEEYLDHLKTKFLNREVVFNTQGDLEIAKIIFQNIVSVYDIYAYIYKLSVQNECSIKNFKIIFRECIFTEVFEYSIPENRGMVYSDSIIKHTEITGDITLLDCEFKSLVTLKFNHPDRHVMIESSVRGHIKDLILDANAGHGTFGIKNYSILSVNCSSGRGPKSRVFEGCIFGSRESKKLTSGSASPIVFNANSFSFDNIVYKDCIFLNTPNFYDTLGEKQKFGSLILFLGCQFEDFGANSVLKYRYLKNKMLEVHNEYMADFFSSLEIEARNINELSWTKDPLEKSFSLLYKLLSNYGRDVIRPLAFLVILCSVFAFLFFQFNMLSHIYDEEKSPLWTAFDGNVLLKSSWVLSFINTIGPLGFFYDVSSIELKNFCAFFFSAFQKAISTVIWFLWFLQIRRRFKLSS
jgi:hypothetical protein